MNEQENHDENFYAMIDRKIAAGEELCRQTGLKLTHQRMQILRFLAEATDHPTAERLYQRVREKIPTISLDTVYRTLATFDRLGLIQKLHGIGAQTHYDPALFPHHHFVCMACGHIEDVEWAPFDQLPNPPGADAWGEIYDKQVVLRGLCRGCRQGEQ
jgi:Fur family peroxide stress response transcriptional regulator